MRITLAWLCRIGGQQRRLIIFNIVIPPCLVHPMTSEGIWNTLHNTAWTRPLVLALNLIMMLADITFTLTGSADAAANMRLDAYERSLCDAACLYNERSRC